MINKLKIIIGPSARNKLLKIFLFLLIGMVFEILGIGLLVPVMEFLLEIKDSYFEIIIDKLFSFLRIELSKISITVLFIVFFLLRTIIIILISYFQNRLVANIVRKTANKLINVYLSLDYLEFKKGNTSSFLKNILIEVHYLSDYLFALVLLLVESSISIALIVTLMIIEFKASILTILTIVLSSFSINYFLKKRINRWGKKREYLDARLSKIVNENLNSFKEIRLNNALDYFSLKFSQVYKPKSDIYINQKTVSIIPRFVLELVSVIAIFIFCGFLIYQGIPNEQIFIKTGIFISVAFRLLPSFSRIISSYQRLNYFKPSVEKIYNELDKKTSIITKKRGTSELKNLDIRNINFSYKPDQIIFQDFNFKIKKNQLVAIIGESGKGKSTLIDIILGLIKPEKSQIFINDKLSNSLGDISIGYVPQSIYVLDDSIKRNIAFGLDNEKIDLSKINKVLKQTNLFEFVNSTTNGIDTEVGENGNNLSGGQIQRLAIARALYNSPAVLIMDEPTSALDEENEIQIMRLINQIKIKTPVIITTHNKRILDYCDKIYDLDKTL